jgi:formylglycine-generating enzyme required for sulfatase activity
MTDYANASASQWYNACASGSATNSYPYGQTYSATACNGYDYWRSTGTGKTISVGSLARCQASPPYNGVHDLSGNANEWEDSCRSPGQSEICSLRGGAFDHGYYFACNDDDYDRRDIVKYYIGFRCCSP